MSNLPYDKKFKSTCSYCGVGCGVEITDLGNGKIHVEGDKDHPSSKGMLCSKGMNLHYTVNDKSDRLSPRSSGYFGECVECSTDCRVRITVARNGIPCTSPNG